MKTQKEEKEKKRGRRQKQKKEANGKKICKSRRAKRGTKRTDGQEPKDEELCTRQWWAEYAREEEHSAEKLLEIDDALLLDPELVVGLVHACRLVEAVGACAKRQSRCDGESAQGS